MRKDFGVIVPEELNKVEEPKESENKRGRPHKKRQPHERAKKRTVEELTNVLPKDAWSETIFRQGTKGPIIRNCCVLRVIRVRKDNTPTEVWLVGEKSLDEKNPDPKWVISNCDSETSLERIVKLAHRRYNVEQFYEDAKQELGFDDYQVRSWPGLHRHLFLVMLAYSFLALSRKFEKESVSFRTHPPEPRGTIIEQEVIASEPNDQCFFTMIVRVVRESIASVRKRMIQKFRAYLHLWLNRAAGIFTTWTLIPKIA